MARNNAYIPNIAPMIAAGINPKTGLPIKYSNEYDTELKTNIKKLLRIKDEQDAINRITWYNLPSGLDSRLLERIIYYKAQGAFFYMKENQKFYFLPYTMRAPEGSIGLDVYGRFTGISPLCFNGGTTDTKDKAFIPGLLRIPQYEVVLPDELTDEIRENAAVLLFDYSNQISQTNISRQTLNDPLLDVMADCIPFMRTNLLTHTGVSGMKVETEDEASNVVAASSALDNAALSGKKWIPIVGHTEFQDLTQSAGTTSDQYLMAMQSLDNFRLSLYGLDSGGIFQKKQHMLQTEMDMNAANASLSMNDALEIRHRFCDIVNSIWGLGIWCEVTNITKGAGEQYSVEDNSNEDEVSTADREEGINE